MEYAFGNRNWNFSAWHMGIDPGFRADLGFMGQVGYEKSLVGGGHSWYRDDTAFNRVHTSNMSKLGEDGKPVYREDGKVMKGPNYKPADLSDLV